MNRDRRLSVDLSGGTGLYTRRPSFDYSAGIEQFSRRPTIDFGSLGLPVSLPQSPTSDLNSPPETPSRRPSVDLTAGLGVTVKIVLSG